MANLVTMCKFTCACIVSILRIQFIPVFEQEVSAVAAAKGVELTNGFSAMELFKNIDTNYLPCEEMFEAVARVKQSGESCSIDIN